MILNFVFSNCWKHEFNSNFCENVIKPIFISVGNAKLDLEGVP